MRGIELHLGDHGAATALTASGVHRFNRAQARELLDLLNQPDRRGDGFAQRANHWLEASHLPRAHRFPGCWVCTHRRRDQIEAELDNHRSKPGIAARYGVPVSQVREHRRRGRHRQ